MKKKIRYSEFTVPAPPPLTRFTPASTPAVPAAPAVPATPVAAAAPAAAAASVPTPASSARPPVGQRTSQPVDLARALAQARAAEAARAAETLAHVEARAAAAHARGLAAAEAEAAATAATMQAPLVEEIGTVEAPAPETSDPIAPAAAFEYKRMYRPDDDDDEEDDEDEDDDEPELRGPRRPLRERARGRAGVAELLMFRIGGERFAVELICVEEAIDLPDVHHVPEMPPAMMGVITVRGALTPVFTPDAALGVPIAGRGAALIFRSDRGRFALAIDDVDDVMTLDLALLRDAPGSEVADSVILGVARTGNVIVALVDADALVMACQALPVLELA